MTGHVLLVLRTFAQEPRDVCSECYEQEMRAISQLVYISGGWYHAIVLTLSYFLELIEAKGKSPWLPNPPRLAFFSEVADNGLHGVDSAPNLCQYKTIAKTLTATYALLNLGLGQFEMESWHQKAKQEHSQRHFFEYSHESKLKENVLNSLAWQYADSRREDDFKLIHKQFLIATGNISCIINFNGFTFFAPPILLTSS